MPGLLTGYDPRTTSSYAAISGVSNSGLKAIQTAQQKNPENYSSGLAPQVNAAAEWVKDAVGDFPVDNSDSNSPPRVNYPPSAPRLAAQPKKVKKIDYTNADIAKLYGMSKTTAYQEALANTSYQRAVKDMQSAGLNPSILFGAGRATPASASVYASEDQPAGSGGFSYGGRSYGRSAASSGKKLFSSAAYNVIQTIGGLVGIATTKRLDGYWIGSQVTRGAMSLMDGLFK